MKGRDAVSLQGTTSWGARDIQYVLTREPRRDLLITVYPDLRVSIHAPEARPLEQVESRIHARRSWIARQLREFERLPPFPPPARFISGESYLYLGRQYRLRVEQGTPGVSVQGGRLVVRSASTGDEEAVRASLNRWFWERGRTLFPARMRRLQESIPMLAKAVGRVQVRRMKRRWGSCTPRGTICLNCALIQASPYCIDYVLSHEMVHLLEPTHSKRFYRLLTRAMPDWEKRRERLNRFPLRWFD